MQPEQILINVSEEVEPVHSAELVLSSVSSSWSGFLVELHRIPETGRLDRFAPCHDLVCLCVSGGGSACVRSGSAEHRFRLEPGTLSIFPGDREVDCVTWSGRHEVLLVDVGNSRIPLWAMSGHEDRVPDLVSRFGIKDPPLAALMGVMRAEIEAGGPIGGTYGESLSLALGAYLCERYASPGPRDGQRRHGLTPSQLRRVREYIHEHICEELSVSTLARLVQLSPRHFSALFRDALGVTPHRYVLLKRIEDARTLLASGRHSILDVAVTLGFASQSHFTDVFRRLTGTTPGQYRRRH